MTSLSHSRRFMSLPRCCKPTTLRHPVSWGQPGNRQWALLLAKQGRNGCCWGYTEGDHEHWPLLFYRAWLSPPAPSCSGLPSSHTVCHLAFDRSASNLATSFRSCNDTSNFQMHSRTIPMSRIASDTPNMIMGMFGGLGQSVGADGIIFRSCDN